MSRPTRRAEPSEAANEATTGSTPAPSEAETLTIQAADCEGPFQAAAPEIRLTQSAIDRVLELRARLATPNALMRLRANPSAPVAGKYELEFIAESDVTVRDRVITRFPVHVVIDQESLHVMKGTLVDYVVGMWQSGFRFTNPTPTLVMSDPQAATVRDYLKTNIEKELRAHDGEIELVDVRAGTAYIAFGGRCQGCGLAPQTFRAEIVGKLLQAFPFLQGVVDSSDHASGVNPYYR